MATSEFDVPMPGQASRHLAQNPAAFARWHLAGYVSIAVVSAVPAIWMMAIDLPVQNRSYVFVPFALTILAALLLLRPLQLVATRHEAPTRQLVADVAANWPWIATAGFMAIALPLTLDEATTVKKHIPELVPFYADTVLMRLDAVFGIDPWRITHAIFGQTATRAFDLIYGLWHLVNIGLGIWIVLARDRRFQIRAALSYQLAWLILGAALALAFSSVGPCFVDDFLGSDYYAALMARLPEDLNSLRSMNYLLATQGHDAIGGGISAMPSMHVAVVVLTALCVRDRFPKWQWLAWAFAAIIYIVSIHLGWHYASDGIVSAVVTVAIWMATGRFVEWLSRPPLPSEAVA